VKRETGQPLRIRRTRRSDLPALLRLIDALADYERLARPDAAARKRLLHDGFLAKPRRFQSYLIELAGEPVGYAIVFFTYSSFLARPTLYLEDVFVLPEHRGKGIGRALMRMLAREALRRGCARMEWMVLTWNEPAIRFYKRLGAHRLDDWALYRFNQEDLRTFGS
jgi:GNAT superfamily N-acetyltransferase